MTLIVKLEAKSVCFCGFLFQAFENHANTMQEKAANFV